MLAKNTDIHLIMLSRWNFLSETEIPYLILIQYYLNSQYSLKSSYFQDFQETYIFFDGCTNFDGVYTPYHTRNYII